MISIDNRSENLALYRGIVAGNLQSKLEKAGFNTHMYVHQYEQIYLNLDLDHNLVKMETPQLSITNDLVGKGKIRLRMHWFGLNGYSPSESMKELSIDYCNIAEVPVPEKINNLGWTFDFNYENPDVKTLMIQINACMSAYRRTDLDHRLILREQIKSKK